MEEKLTYYQKNREKILEQRRKRYSEDENFREQIKQNNKKYVQSHQEQVRETKKRWEDNNKEKVKESKHKHYIKNKDKFLERNRTEENREKRRLYSKMYRERKKLEKLQQEQNKDSNPD